MIKTVLNVRQELVYQNPELGESYRRVLGGLAWPDLPEPGYLLVLGEAWTRDEDLKARPLRVLAERALPGIQELHRGCLELRKLCAVGEWLTDMNQRHEVSLFLRQNQEWRQNRGGGGKDIFLRQAPYSREHPDLGIYLQLVRELVQEGKKVLTFGESSQLNGYLLARQPEEMEKPAAQFPPLAALGYAVAEAVLREPVDPRVLQQKPVTTWNRMQWVEGRG